MGVQYLLKVAVFLVAGSLAACGGSGGGDDGGGDNQKPPVVNSFQAAPNAADIDTPVTFSWDVSDANGDTLTCTLDVDGDGTADHTISDCANTTSQAHTYTAAGSYSATLSVSDGNGGEADRTVAVTVTAANTPPVFGSDFSATPNPATAGSPVTFNWAVSDADGDTLTCSLDVDGDSTADYTIPDCANTGSQAHTYATAGAYAARLIIDDDEGGVVEQTVSVTVDPAASNTAPVFDTSLGVTPNPVEEGSPATFTWAVNDADGDPLTCTLDADGDGSTDYTIADCASNGSQAHTYVAAGSYSATLTVSDGKGGSVAQSLAVTVSAANTAPVFDTSLGVTPNPVEEGSPATFTWAVGDADGDTLTCELDIDADGSIEYTINDCANNASQMHTYGQAGTYQARLSVSDGIAPAVQSTTDVTVSAPPVINEFTVSPNPAYATVATTFYWQVSDADGDTLTCELDVDADGTNDYTINDCANTASQGHTYATSGNYTARLTVSDGVSAVQATLSSLEIVSPLLVDISVNGPAVAGGRVPYTITVSNVSAQPMDDVSVVFTVPPELRFNYMGDAEPDASCSNVWCVDGLEATWALDTLAAGESRTITINAPVVADVLAGSLITAPVRVT
ncbi:MAG TPA: PKD domain-containing protein, partial [Gammaproteobacteria bacterium]|nr:PKD domain-containing protein [Gammaproteobacteria bacterium]